jgi:hypothetical protein
MTSALQQTLIEEVLQLTSPKSGNVVANQQVVKLTNGLYYFYSYGTLIAASDNLRYPTKMYVTDSWDYSKTTLTYLKQFFNFDHSKKEIEKLIKEGTILPLN